MADVTSVHRTDHERRNRLVTAMIVVATVTIVLTIDTDSAAVGEEPVPRFAGRTTGAVIPPTTTVSPVATTVPLAPATTVVPQPVDATPVLVPDARVGDLRVDPNADLLSADYEAPAAAATLLDLAYGPDPAQRLDLHLPAEPDAPLVVFLHSGGWVGGDKRNVPELILRFVERGYAVASVNYRLAPAHPFPAPVDDVVLAIDWLRTDDARAGYIDGDRLVLAGVSAGGHLAAFVGAIMGGPGSAGVDDGAGSVVDAVVAIVAPMDLTTLYGHDHPWARPLTEAFVGCSPCGTEALVEASPIGHLHGDLPPAYWAFGAEDALVDIELQGMAVADAWAAAAGPESSWLDVAEDQGHNLGGATVNQRFLEAFVDRAVDR